MDIKLILIPNRGKKIIEPRTERGIPNAVQKAVTLVRKIISTTMTSMIPIFALFFTIFKREFSVVGKITDNNQLYTSRKVSF